MTASTMQHGGSGHWAEHRHSDRQLRDVARLPAWLTMDGLALPAAVTAAIDRLTEAHQAAGTALAARRALDADEAAHDAAEAKRVRGDLAAGRKPKPVRPFDRRTEQTIRDAAVDLTRTQLMAARDDVDAAADACLDELREQITGQRWPEAVRQLRVATDELRTAAQDVLALRSACIQLDHTHAQRAGLEWVAPGAGRVGDPDGFEALLTNSQVADAANAVIVQAEADLGLAERRTVEHDREAAELQAGIDAVIADTEGVDVS